MVLDPPQVPTGQRFLKLWQLLKLWQPHIYTYIYIYIATYSIYIPETKNRQLHFQRPLYRYTVLDVSQIPTRRCCVKHHRRAIYIYCICLIAWWKYFKKTISYIYIYIYTDFLRFDVVQRCIENQKRMLISKGSAVCLWMWMPRYNRHWQSISKIITVYIQIYINIYTYIVYI